MSNPADIFALIDRVRSGGHLTREESRTVFEQIMTGQVAEPLMAELLTALAEKGETAEEIAGAADVMNEKVTRVHCSESCIDTCGTGGDGISTFNVSTAAAIIAAGAGACVAKHGNRSYTRVSGSAEVISELGVRIDAPVSTLERCLRECRIAFLYAPNLHPAMKYAAPVRKQLKIRTIFNLLGPLTNPAGARRQLLGVPRPELTEKLGQVLLARGSEFSWVVHGHDGLCDLSITGPTKVTEVRDGRLRTFMVQPDEVGLQQADLSTLLVDSPRSSAAVILEVLDGITGPPRNHAVLNAAGALVVAGLAEDLPAGIAMAQRAIDSGAAAATLRKLAEYSRT